MASGTVPAVHAPRRPGDRSERIAALAYDYEAQPKEFVAACNLCGGTRSTIVTHRDRYGFVASARACDRCALTVLNPRMTAAAYVEFYREAYRPLVSAYHGRRIDAETIQDEQREYAEHMASFMAPFVAGLPRGAALLDVGGSTGIVAAYLARTFGFDATVLDPAPAEIAVAEALGIRTVTALLEEWEPERAYDVIGMFQTIDHLLDVAGALRKLRAAIAPHGTFVMDIVDFRAAYLRNASVESAVKIDHPFSLTEDTAELFLARAGFEPVGKSYAPDHLHVAYVCRPVEPAAAAAPDPAAVRQFFREVRAVQNGAREGR
jgi:2-polyprenyl-3-methyl-5-hydroxy-6-metoxy-1,4-benzoquinol methylase